MKGEGFELGSERVDSTIREVVAGYRRENLEASGKRFSDRVIDELVSAEFEHCHWLRECCCKGVMSGSGPYEFIVRLNGGEFHCYDLDTEKGRAAFEEKGECRTSRRGVSEKYRVGWRLDIHIENPFFPFDSTRKDTDLTCDERFMRAMEDVVRDIIRKEAKHPVSEVEVWDRLRLQKTGGRACSYWGGFVLFVLRNESIIKCYDLNVCYGKDNFTEARKTQGNSGVNEELGVGWVYIPNPKN